MRLFAGYVPDITTWRLDADTVVVAMERQHIDITRGLEGESVVHAVFDLHQEEIGASAHAVAASCAERFRNTEMSADDVVEFRELTALADELRELVGGAGTIVMRPARLNAYRAALGVFVESRDDSEWIREEDREALSIARGMLWPLEQLSADAMEAALSAPASRQV
jgi:hypothetical protein